MNMWERNNYKSSIPSNINIYCNKCNIDVYGKLRTSTYIKGCERDDNNEFGNAEMIDVGVYRCPNCGNYISVYFRRIGNNFSDTINFHREQSYPNNTVVWKFKYVDESIKNNLINIYRVYDCRVYDSAIISARTLLQKVIRKIGENIIKDEDDDLRKEIDRLYINKLITKDLKDTAHIIRITGNKYAHPENIHEVFNKLDADNIIKLLENFILLLIEVPNELKDIKESKSK